MKISKRTQQKFADFATDNGVLRTIRDVFEAEDFEEPDNFKSSPMTGERRTLVASFHSLINFNDEAQQRRLLRVYLHAIDDWGRGFIDGRLTDDAKTLIRSLRRDGAPIDEEGNLVDVGSSPVVLPSMSSTGSRSRRCWSSTWTGLARTSQRTRRRRSVPRRSW